MKTIYMAGFAADIYALGVLKNRRPELTLHYSERYISEAEKQINKDSEQVRKLVCALLQKPDTETGRKLWESEPNPAQKPEQRNALDANNVYFLENYEHGVFEGLYVLAKELKAGFRIAGEELPIRQFGLEISEYTDVNPFEQKSSGVIFVSEKTVEELTADLAEAVNSSETVKGTEAVKKAEANSREAVNGPEAVKKAEASGTAETSEAAEISGAAEAAEALRKAASDYIRKIGYLTKNPSKIIVGFAEEKDGAPVERNLNRPGCN